MVKGSDLEVLIGFLYDFDSFYRILLMELKNILIILMIIKKIVNFRRIFLRVNKQLLIAK